MAYVLAGGRGSRLLELTDIRAKPAVYFGGKSRIIDFALSNALNSGIRRIGVATQYKAHSLVRHLQRGWNFFRPERNESFDILPASQRSEHGGFGHDDTNVPILLSMMAEEGRNGAGEQVFAPVTTAQIAPTILAMLGLNPMALDAVRAEGTRVLPSAGE